MKDIRWTEDMPPCDIGLPHCGPGEYDAPTKMGAWGNLCEQHMKEFGIPGPAFHRVRESDG